MCHESVAKAGAAKAGWSGCAARSRASVVGRRRAMLAARGTVLPPVAAVLALARCPAGPVIHACLDRLHVRIRKAIWVFDDDREKELAFRAALRESGPLVLGRGARLGGQGRSRRRRSGRGCVGDRAHSLDQPARPPSSNRGRAASHSARGCVRSQRGSLGSEKGSCGPCSVPRTLGRCCGAPRFAPSSRRAPARPAPEPSRPAPLWVNPWRQRRAGRHGPAVRRRLWGSAWRPFRHGGGIRARRPACGVPTVTRTRQESAKASERQQRSLFHEAVALDGGLSVLAGVLVACAWRPWRSSARNWR